MACNYPDRKKIADIWSFFCLVDKGIARLSDWKLNSAKLKLEIKHKMLMLRLI